MFIFKNNFKEAFTMENERNDRPMHKKARKKVCHFCVDRVEVIDYKDIMNRFMLWSKSEAYCPRGECFDIGFEALMTLDAPNELPGITLEAGHPLNPSRYLIYNDPLEGLLDCQS